MFEWVANSEAWLSLGTLTMMEIILGIDNIVFITILCGDLPEDRQTFGRRLGIGVALISRLALLGVIGWVMALEEYELFVVPVVDFPMTGKDLILLVGGLFLIGKATHEIYENVEKPEASHIHSGGEKRVEETHEKVTQEELAKAVLTILGQVMLIDLVFSLDSVLTAIGMVDTDVYGMAGGISIMATAMVIAVVVMLIFAGPIGDFIERTPSVRILALAFLMLIGVMLVMEGTGAKVSKGYIYSAMGFALFVEMINLRRKSKTDKLQGADSPDDGGTTDE